MAANCFIQHRTRATMAPLSYVTVDVFTDTRFGGNQLAVIFGAEDLSTEEMLSICIEVRGAGSLLTSARAASAATLTSCALLTLLLLYLFPVRVQRGYVRPATEGPCQHRQRPHLHGLRRGALRRPSERVPATSHHQTPQRFNEQSSPGCIDWP